MAATDEARMYVQIAKEIRQERQALADRRDNGDASCLTRAAELRRQAADDRKGGRR